MSEVNVFIEEEGYNRMKERLLRKYEGKVVAIKNGMVIGVYDSEEEAYRDVVEKYGPIPILIKRILRKEQIEYLPAYVYGLLLAVIE